MTVNVTEGPGIAAYESTRYTASVNGSTAWVAAQSHGMTVPSPHWTQVTPEVEISWVKFNGDETATVSITKTSGPISAAVVYPKNVATQIIVGGILILTVPTNTRLHIEVDNDRANAILVFSQPTARAIPAGAVYWDDVGVKSVSIDHTAGSAFTSIGHGLVDGQRVGFRTDGDYPTTTGDAISPHTHYYVRDAATDTFNLALTEGGAAIDFTSNGTGTRTVYITGWTNTTNALVFPDSSLIGGAWHIGRLFELADGVKIVLQPDAVVIGGFDLRGIGQNGGATPGVISGASIFGEGLLLGTYATHAELFNISNFPTFASQLPYCMFLGYDGEAVHWDNEVQGVTIASLPFFANFEGVCEWTNVQCINPWFYGTLTPQLSSKSSALPAGQMTFCYSYSGDDVLTLGEQVSSYFAVVQGCFLATANNSCLHFGYWSQPDASTFCFVRECELMHLGVADNGPGSTVFPTYGGNSIMKCWTDGYDGEEHYGRFDVTVNDCRVWGAHASRLLTLMNKSYPYTYYDDESRDRKGQAARFLFDGLTVEAVPGQTGAIEGLDWLNTPHDIAFKGFTIAGVPITAANFETYITRNVYPYTITVEGHPLVTSVDICNRALDLIGHQKRITALGPSDGSAEALTCLDHYSDSVNQLLEMREWNFATVKRELVALDESDDPAYDYCYEVPAGMLKAISVLEDGASDNNLRNGREVAPQEYDIHADTDDVVRIYTDVGDAWLRFTKYVTDPNLFPPTFLNALYWLLAANIAGPIIKGAEGSRERDRCMQMFSLAMAEASKIDAQQQKPTTKKPLASWHLRGGAQ